MGHTFIPDQAVIEKLKKSDNPVLKGLGEKNGIFPPNTTSDIFKDFTFKRLNANGISFVDSPEHRGLLNETFEDSSQEQTQKDKALSDFITVTCLANMPSELSFKDVQKNWNSEVIDVFQKALAAVFASTDKANSNKMTMKKKTDLTVEDGKWVINVTLSNAVLMTRPTDGEASEYRLPGEIKASFVLTDQGFALRNYNTSQLALAKFLEMKPHVPKSQRLAGLNEEGKFEQQIADFEMILMLKEVGENNDLYQSILDELKILKTDASKGNPSFATLNEILDLTTAFCNNDQIDFIKTRRYNQLANELSKQPKTTRLAQAMGIVLGVGLIAASITMLVLTLGASIPFCIPGLIGGIGLVGMSAFSIYSSKREKPLQKKMRNLLTLFPDKLEENKRDMTELLTGVEGKLQKRLTQVKEHKARLSTGPK